MLIRIRSTGKQYGKSFLTPKNVEYFWMRQMLKGKMSLVGLVAQFAYLLLLSLRDEPEFVLQPY